jgi:hypothetical protein
MTTLLITRLGPLWSKMNKGHTALLLPVARDKHRLAAHLKQHPQDIPLARHMLGEWIPEENVTAFITAWVLELPHVYT